jgi:hypothetical protein
MTVHTLLVASAVLVLTLGASPGRALADDQKPRTEPVAGDFSASPVDVKQRTCVGEDGPYLELRGRWAGVITSNDPRLAGTLTFRAEPALINLATGFGTFQGPFRISDSRTGETKTEGTFHSVVTNTALNHGFAVGTVLSGRGRGDDDGNDDGSDRFFTNFKALLDAALNVTGEYGGTGDPRTPGVIQGGSCSGRFTPVP